MSTLLKKVTASAAALSIVLSIVSPVVGVQAADENTDAANRLAALGVIVDNSKDPSKYNLGSNITRREMLKVMMNLSSVEVGETCEGKFSDLPASDWGCKYAESALKAGFIAANKKFRPNDLVTEAEALKMVMQARGLAKKDGVADWAQAYAEAAVEAGILADAKVSTKSAKRSFVIVSADNAVTKSAGETAKGDSSEDDLGGLFGDLFGDDKGTDMGTGSTSTGTTSTGTVSTGTVAPVATGDLDLALNPASPANGAEVPGTGSVLFAKVDLTAGKSDVSVNTVELKKVGLGTVNTDNVVWFEKAGQKVSSEVSFNNEGTAVVSFSPALVVKAGSTETLDLYVELLSKSGVDYQFTSGVVRSSAANVKGSFTTAKLRTVEYSANKVDVVSVATTSSYKASSDLIDIGAFRLTNETPSGKETTDVKVNSVSLYLSGSANLTNLSDFQLVKNGLVVATGAKVDGRYLTFVLADTIKDNLSASYYVKAKVVKVENQADTYQLRLKDKSDLNVSEVKNGFRVTVKATPNLSAVTIEGGELRFERDSSVSLDATYAPGSSQVTLMQGKIVAKNDIKIKNIYLSGSTGVKLSDFFNTVYLSVGSSVISATPSTTAGADIAFKGTFNISGTSDVKVYGTLKGTSTGTIKIGEMKLASLEEKEFVSNQQTVTSGVGSIPSISVKVEESVLNATKNDGLGNTKLVAGTKAATVYGMSLSSTKGNPINVTSLTFDTNLVGTASNNVFATLYVDGTAVSSKTLDASTVRFEGFTAQVTKDKAVNVVVKADLSDSFTSGSFKLALTAADAIDTETSKSITPSSKPEGALISVEAATATVAATDVSPKATLIEAGKTGIKLFSFKASAKNDNLKLDDVTLSGTNLNKFSNYRLVSDASASGVAVSTTVTASKVTFESFASDKTVIQLDKNVTFTVVADANSNSTGSIALQLTEAKLNQTNGSNVDATGTGIVSNTHALVENALVVAKVANSNKSLSNALVLSITATGKDSVTLKSLTAAVTQLVGYDAGATYKFYKNSVSPSNEVNFTTKANATVDAGSTVNFVVEIVATKTAGFTGTPSIDVEVSDIETTEIASVKVYDNAGLSAKLVESIK